MLEASVTDAAAPAGSAPLARGQGVALWRQIAGTLEKEIAGGGLQPGARLPTEADLTARFAVNRHTVRRAMEELQSRGLVRIEQGRGSFVAEDVLDYPLGPRTRFSETIRRQNREPQGRILRLEEIDADAHGGGGAEAAPRPSRGHRRASGPGRWPAGAGWRALLLRRPLPRHRPLLAEDASITRALATLGVADYRRQTTRITARMPTVEEARAAGAIAYPPGPGDRGGECRSCRRADRVEHRLLRRGPHADPGGKLNMVQRSWRIEGGTALVDGALRPADIALAAGRIAESARDACVLDARGLLVLPGLVDIHGDAHERSLQPRPGIGFPVPLAVRDTAAQLLGCGITTAYLGVTLSWEPGLRSLETWRLLMAALDVARPGLALDLRVHLRFEADNLDALDDALADIAAGRVHLLGFNDHTPAILKKLGNEKEVAKYAGRAGCRPPSSAP